MRGRDVDLQALLTAAEGAEVRNHPVQIDQLQQALDEASRLAKRHAEKHLHRQAGLDRRIAVVGLSARLPVGEASLGHGGIEPALWRLKAIAYRPTDRQRATALRRFIAGRAVPGLAGGRAGLLMPSSHHTGVTR